MQLTGCRYVRAIKQSLNKVFQNKSSLNNILAEIIAQYSHKSLVRPGSYLLGNHFNFFIVKTMISPHWCEGFFCPPRIEYRSLGVGHFYTPNISNRSRIKRKRIFEPFAEPQVRIRDRKFLLESKLVNDKVKSKAN